MKRNFNRVWSFLAAVSMLMNVLLPTGAIAAGEIRNDVKAGVTIDDPTPDYNAWSILGNGIYYGIVADTLEQKNHLQTNFAVKTYEGGASNVQPDWSGNSAGSIYVAHITKPFNINAGGREVIIYTGENLTLHDEAGKKYWTKNKNNNTVFKTKTYFQP